jgi:hypothetical protein
LKLLIHHRTRHVYDSPVTFGDHHLYLRPRDSFSRRVVSFDLSTTPEATFRWVMDAEGNLVRVCNFGLQPSTVLEFDLTMVMEVEEVNPFDFILDADATGFPFMYSESDQSVLASAMRSTSDFRVLPWFRGHGVAPDHHEDIVQFLADLNSTVHTKIAYVRRDEEGIQTPQETLSLGSGSCRDMAVLFVTGVRELGMAARFVSGYLYDPPDGDGHVFNRAVGSMHAWVEVYLPGAGWKGFDPTNGILANGNFIPAAVSSDPKRVDPVQGTYFAKQSVDSAMEVELTLEELRDDPV